MHVVGERAPAVDLDDGKPLPIPSLEGWVIADVDLAEVELDLRPNREQHIASALAEMAALGVKEDDRVRYG
jgi:hypothetical protein